MTVETLTTINTPKILGRLFEDSLFKPVPPDLLERRKITTGSKGDSVNLADLKGISDTTYIVSSYLVD